MFKNTETYSLVPHVLVALLLLMLHVLLLNYYSNIYFKIVEMNLSENDGQLFKQGQYEPLLTSQSRLKVPENYLFVIVKNKNHTSKEIYYTKDGKIVTAHYDQNQIVKISGKYIRNTASLVIPVVGIFFIVAAMIKESFRKKDLTWWRLGNALDRVEKVLYFYGLFLFCGGIMSFFVVEIYKGIKELI